MDFGLKDKVAIVTGGARGIGRIDSIVLAREGARVIIIDILKSETEDVVREIHQEGGNAEAVNLDISDRTAVADAVQTQYEKFGQIDILVNNAAIVNTLSTISKFDDEKWERDLKVNLTGAYNITKAVFPVMKANKWGRIVWMSSIVGLSGGFAQASYTTTKMGIVGLAKTIALEGARHNITSNVIAPGIIGSEVFLTSVEDNVKNEVRKRTAFGREGETWDIANAIAFLCSEQARYITGIVLPVMGGLDLFTIFPA